MIDEMTKNVLDICDIKHDVVKIMLLKATDNKVSSEDDISTADVLITVKTGEVILFAGLTLTIIVTIGIGVYFIKRKVIK